MSAPSVSLLMAIHCHQPVGNFGFVFEEAFRQAYEPFLATLERHPAVRVSVHYSGPLLDWLGEHQPKFLDRVGRLVRRGQIELLASGYYEPILPMIPEGDRRDQIRQMQQALARRFGTAPSGLWLTERVWEPELPETLAACDVRYTLLDVNQFQVARPVLPSGLQVQDDQGWDLLGAYVTEYGNHSVIVFPASKRLRYWIPFQEVSRTIEFLRRLQPKTPVAITYADDGEKFGLWPKTHHWVYEQGWLERFFTALERESSWLSTATFSGYLSQAAPDGRVYLPCGSYEEMLEWSGGYFRNFLVKYPEANAMHKKMLGVSREIQDASGIGSRVSSSTKRRDSQHSTRNSKLIERARHELHQAQCNDAYWHGVFGGLYLSHLRRAVYHHLITAERLVHEATGRSASSELLDLDGDGQPEVRLRNRALGLIIDPAENGTVTELDCYGKAVNLFDTLSRRHEPYHEKLKAKRTSTVTHQAQTPASIHDLVGAKEAGLETMLAYDDHRRCGFIDYAMANMPTLQEIVRSTWGEHRLWSGGPWELATGSPRISANGTTLALTRRIQEGRLRKTITLARDRSRIAFQYECEGVAIPVVGLEFNLSLRDERLAEARWETAVGEFRVQEPSLGVAVTMRFERPTTLAHFPIETVSESEEGMERTAQGLAVVCLWATPQSRRWSCGMTWTIEES